jgi:hypothetical protein
MVALLLRNAEFDSRWRGQQGSRRTLALHRSIINVAICSAVIAREGGRTSNRRLRRWIAALAFTGCPAFAGHDGRERGDIGVNRVRFAVSQFT